MVTGEMSPPIIVCADIDKSELGSAMMGGVAEPVTVYADTDELEMGAGRSS